MKTTFWKIACTSLAVFSATTVANAQLTGTVQPSVSVTGNCLRSVQTDRGSITVTADVLSKDLPSAARQATEAYERVKKAVQKLNLKNMEISTSEYNFQEVREQEKNRMVSKGFRARMGLTVSTSEISRLGEVITLAAKEGIRDVGSLNAFLSPEKQKVEHEACLEEAVKNARSKADVIAKAASSKLGRVLGVQENGGGFAPPPMPMRFKGRFEMAADAEMASPSIDAGPQRISLDLNVVFALQ